MDIGVPKEARPFEYRVSLTPSMVSQLTEIGNRVYIETDAGSFAGFSNLDYEQAGGIIVYEKEEIFVRPDILVKVSRPTFEEIELMKDELVILGLMHFHASKQDKINLLVKKKITVIALELLKDNNEYPIMKAISNLAGKMIPYIAGQLLTNIHGGSGIVISGAPGIPPAEVVIIGAGQAGTTITKEFMNIGAQVTVLDKSIKKLEELTQKISPGLVTMINSPKNLSKVVSYADILITCASSSGNKAPILLNDETIKSMKYRSIFIDLSIDSGGCSTTSRPTNHGTPTYIKYNVIHYCVPNISSIIARSSSYALNNSLKPYLIPLLESRNDFHKLINTNPFWKTGLIINKGEIIHEYIKNRMGSIIK